ncbi:hypothetical protein C8Q76DRAFT_790764 [Earliella scabrosa]|nr:hypothetical protein C8Q76DRAFT_790764 [Earliella scabrosa]
MNAMPSEDEEATQIIWRTHASGRATRLTFSDEETTIPVLDLRTGTHVKSVPPTASSSTRRTEPSRDLLNKVTPVPSDHGTKKSKTLRFTSLNIPRDMLQAYNERLTPLAMAFAGMGEPFCTPTLELAQTMFDLAYPDHNYTVREDDVFFYLIGTRYSGWQHKMREGVLEVLKHLFGDPKHIDLHTTESRAKNCAAQLGGLNDPLRDAITDMEAPFFWKNPTPGSLMLATFAWAHQLPTDLHDAIAEMPDSEPAGAIVMAALATEFALHTWQTGIKRTTTAAHGQFSKLNYGDGVRSDPANPREKVEIFPASSLYARAKGMSPDHWNQLMDDAVSAAIAHLISSRPIKYPHITQPYRLGILSCHPSNLESWFRSMLIQTLRLAHQPLSHLLSDPSITFDRSYSYSALSLLHPSRRQLGLS